MILGSHNSLSFAKPTKWWMRPLHFVAKCQSKNIEQQLALGVRYFDFRVRLNEHGIFKPAHGSMIFDYEIKKALDKLENFSCDSFEKIFVRIILEYNGEQKNQEDIDDAFKEYCNDLMNSYSAIVFVGGHRKYDWEVLYKFSDHEPQTCDLYSSTTSPFGKRTNTWLDKIDDWWPWLYARLHNKKNIKRYFKDKEEKEVLFLDFVNIGHKELDRQINNIVDDTYEALDSLYRSKIKDL